MNQHHLLPLSLVALTCAIGTPALAQMKTSKPSASPSPTASPAARPATRPATGSVQAAPMRTTSEVADAGTAWSPLGLRLLGAYDFMGAVNTGGFVAATTAAPGTTAPALAASSSIPAGGFSLGAEYDLPVLTLGARYQTLSFGSPLTAAIDNPPAGITQTSAPSFDVFLPQNYWELYGRMGALKIGYRNENYAGTGFGGSYGNLVAGLNFGLGMDPVMVNFGVLGGYNLSKPASVPAAITHMPAEGDLNLAINFGLVKAKVGYKAMAVANADAGTLLTALTNPASLAVPGGANQATLDALYATRYGFYTGPYAGLEFGF